MVLLTESELKHLSIEQLEHEKNKAQQALETRQFRNDPDRQKLHLEPTQTPFRDTAHPTMKQIEDYLALIEKFEVKQNLPKG